MEQIQLAATRRTVQKGAAKRLRQTGRVPGVLYGHGFDTVPLQFEALALKRPVITATSTSAASKRLMALPSCTWNALNSVPSLPAGL